VLHFTHVCVLHVGTVFFHVEICMCLDKSVEEIWTSVSCDSCDTLKIYQGQEPGRSQNHGL
jgi:hypothetical protein